MRTILFRGKRVDNGELVEGYLIVKEKQYFIIQDSWREPVLTMCMLVDDNEVIPETVGQFTGLKDRNGKMIFEGDIIGDDYDGGKHMSIVKFGTGTWDSGYYRYVGFYCDRVDWEDDIEKNDDGSFNFNHRNDASGDFIFKEDVIIFGNIHDNPELIKSNK